MQRSRCKLARAAWYDRPNFTGSLRNPGGYAGLDGAFYSGSFDQIAELLNGRALRGASHARLWRGAATLCLASPRSGHGNSCYVNADTTLTTAAFGFQLCRRIAYIDAELRCARSFR